MISALTTLLLLHRSSISLSSTSPTLQHPPVHTDSDALSPPAVTHLHFLVIHLSESEEEMLSFYPMLHSAPVSPPHPGMVCLYIIIIFFSVSLLRKHEHNQSKKHQFADIFTLSPHPSTL